MATYTQLVDRVRSWANRDAEILPSATIKTFINFAADNIYRDLRIVPLEYVFTYNISIDADDTDTYCALMIPTDAIEFIQLRRKSQNSLTDYDVFSNKADIRSFNEETQSKYGEFYYTRERDTIILSEDLRDGDVYELYYYRRLAEMDARYTVDSDNYMDSSVAIALSSVPPADTTADPDIANNAVTINGTQYVGALAPNWLRDQNEKLILFGALFECFTYLDEPAQAQTYMQRYMMEMQKLNDEEHKRKYMGGNIQVHYQSHLL